MPNIARSRAICATLIFCTASFVSRHVSANIGSHGTEEPCTHQREDRSLADELAKKVRVLCWVMTQPSNHEKKAKHVKATWGKRCNVLLFMSSAKDAKLPTVKLPVKEGRDYLWGKVKAAFRYVYKHHRRDADWFLKADDDTYVIVENLRYLLYEHDSGSPVYFGCRYKPFSKQGYMSGGAGYVLSKKALDMFVNKALPSPRLCKDKDTGSEDAEMGKCLANISVKALDSRDSLHRGRFFPFVPEDHVNQKKESTYWYWKYVFYPPGEGLDCCSDHAATFHYVKPEQMYALDYFIYHVRPYGITYAKSSVYSVAKSESPARVKKDTDIRDCNPEENSTQDLCWLEVNPAGSSTNSASTD